MADQRQYRGMTKDGKLVKGDIVRSNDGRIAIIPSMEIFHDAPWKKIIMQPVVEVIQETVGQSTGLKDATKWEDLTEEERVAWTRNGNLPSEWNGKEIYEGDIAQSGTEEIYRDVCEWNEGGRFMWVNLSDRDIVEYIDEYEVTVIGTIHDHLLTGESERK